MNLSDAGTGKTRATLEAWKEVKREYGARRLLVVAPLSILEPAWAQDCAYWTPGLTTSIAYAAWRQSAFDSPSDIVVINHDGVNWLAQHPEVLEEFDGLCVDEFTAFKNPTSDRSEALREIRHHFHVRWMMSGTPTPNSVTDIWFPAFICDDGERLGKAFSLFRKEVCDAIPIPGVAFGKNWIDKPHAQDIVAARLRDVSIRYRRDECLDLPDNHQYHKSFELPPEIHARYLEMLRESILELEDGRMIEAVNAAVRVQKLLQICSGAVYDEERMVETFSTSRYELVADLAEARDHSLVGFIWQHQKQALTKAFDKRKMAYAVIDGSTGHAARNEAVERFQGGELRAILAHPQSASHGLTLTRGQATIWSSPTYNAEHFTQFNARINRPGQTRKTETILVTAKDTLEEQVYEKTDSKILRMNDLLTLLKTLYDMRNAA